eukprot:6214110-Pleurochrysis_carterae.AAC.13
MASDPFPRPTVVFELITTKPLPAVPRPLPALEFHPSLSAAVRQLLAPWLPPRAPCLPSGPPICKSMPKNKPARILTTERSEASGRQHVREFS